MADVCLSVGKPAALTGFGLVTQSNAPAFVPFNSTSAPFASENRAKPFEITSVRVLIDYFSELQHNLWRDQPTANRHLHNMA